MTYLIEGEKTLYEDVDYSEFSLLPTEKEVIRQFFSSLDLSKANEHFILALSSFIKLLDDLPRHNEQNTEIANTMMSAMGVSSITIGSIIESDDVTSVKNDLYKDLSKLNESFNSLLALSLIYKVVQNSDSDIMDNKYSFPALKKIKYSFSRRSFSIGK